MRNIFALPICVLLLAIPLTACTTSVAETPAQQYFALKQDYATILTGAAEYSKTCRAAPTKTCATRVHQLQDADDKVAGFFKLADKAMVGQDGEKLAGYLTSIKNGISQMRDLITKR